MAVLFVFDFHRAFFFFPIKLTQVSKERQCPSRARLPPARHLVAPSPSQATTQFVSLPSRSSNGQSLVHTRQINNVSASPSPWRAQRPCRRYRVLLRAHSSLERPSSEGTLPQLRRPDVSTQRLPPLFPFLLVRVCRSNWLKASGRGSHLPSHKGNWTTETRNGFLPN